MKSVPMKQDDAKAFATAMASAVEEHRAEAVTVEQLERLAPHLLTAKYNAGQITDEQLAAVHGRIRLRDLQARWLGRTSNLWELGPCEMAQLVTLGMITEEQRQRWNARQRRKNLERRGYMVRWRKELAPPPRTRDEELMLIPDHDLPVLGNTLRARGVVGSSIPWTLDEIEGEIASRRVGDMGEHTK